MRHRPLTLKSLKMTMFIRFTKIVRIRKSGSVERYFPYSLCLVFPVGKAEDPTLFNDFQRLSRSENRAFCLNGRISLALPPLEMFYDIGTSSRGRGSRLRRSS